MINRMVLVLLSLAVAACATAGNGSKADSPSALAVSATDQALVERLVSAGRLAGTWGNQGNPASGTASFRFYRKDGKLAGEFLGSSGSVLGPTAQTGALRWLTVSGSAVSFSTPVGADYSLRLEGNCLRGSAKLGSRPPIWVEACL